MAYSNVNKGSSNKPAPKSKSLLRKVSGGVSYLSLYGFERFEP